MSCYFSTNILIFIMNKYIKTITLLCYCFTHIMIFIINKFICNGNTVSLFILSILIVNGKASFAGIEYFTGKIASRFCTGYTDIGLLQPFLCPDYSSSRYTTPSTARMLSSSCWWLRLALDFNVTIKERIPSSAGSV